MENYGLKYAGYYNNKLTEFLGFFGCRRFVPIVTAAARATL